MIYNYGFTKRGLAHIKSDTVCQDAHKIICKNNGVNVGAVADGLGSELYSDIASHIAVDVVVDFCAANIDIESSESDILEVLNLSFHKALEAIEAKASENEQDFSQYDTTLSVAVFINGSLFFGHSGDSGIIALADDGIFYKVTSQQRDEEGRVFPLCFGEEYWVFGKFDKKIASVLLATDGLYELFFPIYIRRKKVNIYVALAIFFMNPTHFIQNEIAIEDIIRVRDEYVENLPENVVDDDKTLVVIVDTDVSVNMQNDEYYKEPNWELLKKEYAEEYCKKAYDRDWKN